MTRFRLHEDGTFDVLDGRRVVLARAFARERNNDLRTTERANENTLRGSSSRGEIELHFENNTLRVQIKNLQAPIRIGAVDVLCCETTAGGDVRLGNASELLYFHHGWQSWSKTEMRAMTAPEIPYDGDDFFEKHLPYGAAQLDERTSSAFTFVGRADDEAAMLLGFETGAHQFSMIRFQVDGEKISGVRATVFGDGVELRAGETFESETLMLRFGDANALYEEYVRRVAKNMGRRGKHTTLQGWCSWYYYFGENTADDVRANVNAIRAQNLPLDLIVVDDGYQTAIGDWTSINAGKFPKGMKQIADEIHAAGKLAGIWLAPFGARHDSQLAQRHPEFLLCDENGNRVRAWNHWNEEVYALDLTRPDVQQWLRDLFQTVCHVWGYDAVKLDFVFAGALAGKHFDARLTRAQAYRRGLQVIGETIGAEKIILGCGAPLLASVGLVDAMRVSQDVSFTWEPIESANGGAVSTRHAIQNTLLRAPFNQHWWLNDPDCVIVRQRGDVNLMTRNENRSLASVAALTGSVLLDSDNLVNVAPPYLNDLRRILPAIQNTARVRKWFSKGNEQPSQFELQREDGTWILAAINWDKKTRAMSVELPDDRKYRVYDFWTKKDLGAHRKRVKISKHAPHQTVVLHCFPASRRENKKPALSHIAVTAEEIVALSAE